VGEEMINGKRLIALLLTVLFAVSLISYAVSRLEGEETQVEEEETNLTVIGFSQPGAESAWRVALTDSVREVFTEEKGYKLIYKDGKSKQDNQIKDIRTFIQMGVDYIVLSPIVETGWDSVLEEAKQAGIPVIICDRNVVVSNESLYTAFVGSDFKAEGETAIAYLEELYSSESQAGNEKINIVHIEGTIGSSAQMGRSEALLNAVEEHDNWEIVAEDCGEFTKAKSKEIMTGVLETIDPDEIDVIYCENDEEAMGAMAALNEAGIQYGEGTNIAVISFDATSKGLELCLNNQINIDVECNPLQGPYVYNIISMLQKKKAVPKIAYVDESYFTSENLSEDFIASRKY